jgi:polyhydroxyalkanoate synthase subunit PhaC
VLAASGHIAGVVNAPKKGKYSHWVSEAKHGEHLPKSPDQWLKTAREDQGSWWPDWEKWQAKFNGPKVPARKPGDGGLKPIEDAPGSYVKVMASS